MSTILEILKLFTIPTIIIFVLGLIFIFFAKPIVQIQAMFGLRGIILSRFGIKTRVRITRITGLMMVFIAIFFLVQSWASQFT